MTEPRVRPDPAFALLDLYESALPEVYGYLLSRCGDRTIAEELTSETSLGAVRACRSSGSPPVSTAWLIGVARHKLVDHWRGGNVRNAGCGWCTSPSPSPAIRGMTNWTRS